MKNQKLIIINGLPASGKTTIAEFLSREMQIPMFSKDELKELLSDSLKITSIKGSRRFEDPSYALLFYISKRLLSQKFSLIIESNFEPGYDIGELARQLKEAGVIISEIFCKANGDILIERFKKRMDLRHTIHPRILPPFFIKKLQYNLFYPLNIGKILEVDTSDFSKIPYKKIMRFIRE